MARIFTITEGLENMGTLKTGGQGSVYKGKRIGEIITAIKILPTPVHSESEDDKNFQAFRNEVEKLRRVNEDANPNVVTILRSGITETGSFPFIEMEYIEGPDLEDLLKPPHDMIFTISETLKVAEHLSNALSHCHKADIKHGDIKSNNVKFNTHNGNYILLDFGLSVMSDEQRRTSLRQAGAVEFMAPEQHEGQLLFESEVYSFGVILFELLSGTVPFSLNKGGESARNAVMVAHMEQAPPNLLSLRQQNLPEWWSKEKKEHEMRVPEWLVGLVYKCLEKNPSARFANGMDLHQYIVKNRTLAAGNIEWGAARIAQLEQENERLKKDNLALAERLTAFAEANSISGPSNLPFAQQPKRRSFTARNAIIILLCVIVGGLIVQLVLTNQSQEREKKKEANRALNVANSNAEEQKQLQKAKRLFLDGRIQEARSAYKGLAIDEIPEAMYEYGNLTLLNEAGKQDCAEAMSYLRRAANRGYVPAKRTVGFLYSFAPDSLALKQKGYQLCAFAYDIPRGSRLLMEAALQGDTISSKLLQELNTRFGKQ